MRKSVANYSATLLAVTLIGLVLMSAQLALPAKVESREIPYAAEDSRDSGMSDQAMLVTDKIEGLVSVSEAEAQGLLTPSGS
jgi:hypothetical protein